MSAADLTDEQVVSLVKQLPPRRKRAALLALATESQARRDARLQFGEERLSRACAARGLEWERLSEDERDAFVNRLLHEE